MTKQVLHELAESFKRKHPVVAPGYTVRVHERIREGEKERIQVFPGLVIAVHKGHTLTDSSFTVRRIASGVGVERVFPVCSPQIEKIEVKKVAKVRRAKLSFLRGRQGKAARLSERFTNSDEFGEVVAVDTAPPGPTEDELVAAPAVDGTAEESAEEKAPEAA